MKTSREEEIAARIEAAAKEIHAQSDFAHLPWESFSEETKQWTLRKAEKILAAADAADKANGIGRWRTIDESELEWLE